MDKCCAAAFGTAGYRCYFSRAFSLGSNNYAPPLGQPALKSYREFNEGWPANFWELTERSTGIKHTTLLFWRDTSVDGIELAARFRTCCVRVRAVINSGLARICFEGGFDVLGPPTARNRVIKGCAVASRVC